LRTPKSSFVFAAGWLLLITVLLCIPGTKLPKVRWDDKIWLDKWIHLALFFVLVFLWCKAYTTKTKKTFIVITILSIIYGIAMELVQQYFIPFRSFDYGDMIADSVGSIAGYFIYAKRFLNNQHTGR
jgi:VanZ family protein